MNRRTFLMSLMAATAAVPASIIGSPQLSSAAPVAGNSKVAVLVVDSERVVASIDKGIYGQGQRPRHRPGKGLYVITDNAYQSMFMTYESGVVVVDAPPPYAGHILEAIAEVTNKPIT